jgi:hypothetical protein
VSAMQLLNSLLAALGVRIRSRLLCSFCQQAQQHGTGTCMRVADSGDIR